MRNTASLLAVLASTTSTASATFGKSGGFLNAYPFSSPGNTENKCSTQQQSGWDFGGVPEGPVGSFDGFQFGGFTCKSGGRGKRYEARTFGKSLGGICSSEKGQSPSFGCGTGGPDKFSLGSIHVQPEFDCDLEFHYDMPDGSTCRHRSACSKSGTTVTNNQCGGAKNVTIVYPTQPDKPKPTCSINVPSVSFSCGTPSATTYVPSPTTSLQTTPVGSTPGGSTPVVSTPAVSTPAVSTPIASTPVIVTATPPGGGNYSTGTRPGQTVPTTLSQPGQTYSASQPGETVPTASQPGQTVPTGSQPGQTAPTGSQPGETVPTLTLTLPGQTYSGSQPGGSAPTGSQPGQTVPTGSQPGQTVPTASQPGQTYPGSQPGGTPPTGATSGVIISSATKPGYTGGSNTSPASPVETLPCPGVVPSCLNTFLYTVKCSDNSDTACYCPNAKFVKEVFNCIYAHGESAEVVNEAVSFFQGICAPHASSNPAIVTGATITSYVTLTATPAPTLPAYNTISLHTTTVVPCTDDSGAPIPSSSTTITISTVVTVPQVGLTTGSGGGVGVVPITTPIAAITGSGSSPAATTPAVGGGSGSGSGSGAGAGAGGSYPLGTAPIGSAQFTPTPTPSGFVPVSGAGRIGTSFCMALAAMVFATIL